MAASIDRAARLYAGWVRSASIIALLLATATAGCASAASTPSRPMRCLPAIKACLRATHLAASSVPRNTNLPDRLHPRPVSLLWIRSGPGALIALYATGTDAARIFGDLRSTLPVLRYDNALILTLITPQPARVLRSRIERCAFGPSARPLIGPVVAKG